MKAFWTVLILSICVMAGCNGKYTNETNVKATADSLSKKMITAKIYLKPEYVNEFIEAAKIMIDSSNAESGCESYMLYQNPYDSTELIFVELWKDQAAIDNHFNMPYFKAWGPKTQDWVSKPAQLSILSVVSDK